MVGGGPSNLGFGQLFVASAVATCTAEATTIPLDTAKVKLQLQGKVAAGQVPKYRGLLGTCFTVAKEEGVAALWKGLGPGLQRQVVYGGLRIGLYEPIKGEPVLSSPSCLYVGKDHKGDVGLGTKIAAGLTTGALGITVASPTDLVKVRMQAAGRLPDGHPRKYPSAFSAYATIARTEGVAALWTGLGPNIARNAIINAAELASYDQIKSTLLSTGLMQDNVVCHLTSGLGAGLFAVLCGSPVDVVKSRMMGAPVGTYSGVLDCFAKTFARDGPLAFYAGFGPNFARLGSWNGEECGLEGRAVAVRPVLGLGLFDTSSCSSRWSKPRSASLGSIKVALPTRMGSAAPLLLPTLFPSSPLRGGGALAAPLSRLSGILTRAGVVCPASSSAAPPAFHFGGDGTFRALEAGSWRCLLPALTVSLKRDVLPAALRDKGIPAFLWVIGTPESAAAVSARREAGSLDLEEVGPLWLGAELGADARGRHRAPVRNDRQAKKRYFEAGELLLPPKTKETLIQGGCVAFAGRAPLGSSRSLSSAEVIWNKWACGGQAISAEMATPDKAADMPHDIAALVAQLGCADEGAQHAAARTLCSLAHRDPGAAEAISAAPAIPLLVRLLDASNPGTQWAAVAVLGSLTSGSPANQQAIAAAGTIPALVDMLDATPETVKIAAARALGGLAPFQNRAPNLTAITAARCTGAAIPPLVRMLDATGIAQDTAAWALTALCTSKLDEEAIAAAGAIPPLAVAAAGAISALVRILDAETKATQEAAAAALQNLSIHTHDKTVVAAAGAIPSLLRLLDAGTAQQSAAAALSNLSHACPANQAATAAAGAIPRLVRMLRSSDVGVQHAAILALKSVGCENPANQAAILAAGGPALQRLARESSNRHLRQYAAETVAWLEVAAAEQQAAADATAAELLEEEARQAAREAAKTTAKSAKRQRQKERQRVAAEAAAAESPPAAEQPGEEAGAGAVEAASDAARAPSQQAQDREELGVPAPASQQPASLPSAQLGAGSRSRQRKKQRGRRSATASAAPAPVGEASSSDPAATPAAGSGGSLDAAAQEALVCELVCPITHEPMREPVVAADGRTYERAAIEVWIARERAAGRAPTSPMTGEPLEHLQLAPNHALRGVIGTLTAAGLLR
eukprot:scaffold9.g3286.t1